MTGRRIISYVVAGFLLLVLLYLLFRNYILHTVIHGITQKLQKEYRLDLTIGESGFTGLATVEMKQVSVVPAGGDTLLHLDTLSAAPSIGSLFLFNLRLKSLEMKSGFVRLNCMDSVCNYSSLITKKTDTLKTEPGGKNFASLFYRLFSKAFDFAPQNADLSSLDLSFITDSFQTNLRIPEFHSSVKVLVGELEDVRQKEKWKMSGTFNQSKRKYEIDIYPVTEHHRLPLLKELFNTTADFDTIHVALLQSDYSNGNFKFSGQFSGTALSFYQEKISDDTVEIASGQFDYDVTITHNSFSLDSTSSMMLNKIHVYPFFKYTSDTSKTYELALSTDTLGATDFFSSLPGGVFDETKDIEADGQLQYSLNFRLNSAEPDSVLFDSQMRKKNFRLRKPGKENLFKMNGEFMHTVYEYDKPFRTFPVGPSNPDFTPLDQISQNLRNAILTSEDGSFFFHIGFNEDAFRKSIAENYRKGKFVRGGSTISMQLVKNVFLSRHKTVARKAEEALIVWLIESNRLCSKERMFEVYLNIIELGPGVYGVGEASRFYFNKKPSELTLSESIFLASLLPHPKWFKYSFDAQGNLKPYLADYYRVVSNFLLRKNLITQEEYDHIIPNVELKGIAHEMVVPGDTIPVDEDE